MANDAISSDIRVGRALRRSAERQYGFDMEARVAVLEQIAKNTEKVLDRLDSRMEHVEDRQSSDFKWLLGMGMAATAFLFAAMAHGFHWV